jgi:RimJ/RimL family protein N-acetyltransferase
MTPTIDTPRYDSASRNYWHGQKIRLRAVEPEDAEMIFKLNLNSEMARVLDFVWPPQSIVAVRAWAQRMATAEFKDDKLFLIMEDIAGQAVGTISTHGTNRRVGFFSYGLSVDVEYRGRGYASEAIVMLLRYYFAELGYQKATSTVYECNPPSIRLHERLGYLLEGRIRRHIYTNGRYYDELYFGMTREEFAERYGLEK